MDWNYTTFSSSASLSVDQEVIIRIDQPNKSYMVTVFVLFKERKANGFWFYMAEILPRRR